MTKRIATLAAALTTALAYAHAAGAASSRPNVFINASELDAIRAKATANQQPWKGGYDKMMSDANSAKSKSYSQMPTVADNGGYGGDAHKYKTDRPYSSDGVFDPNADRTDYTDAINCGRAVRNLALAYAFTGDTSYAAKATEYIKKWCLDPDWYMKPQFTDGQSYIEICITIPGIFYGADLLYDYAGWDSSERADFMQWAADFTDHAHTWSRSNNFENWRVNFIATGGALLNDSGHLTYAFDRLKAIIPNQINTTGQMTQELGRTNSLSYSTYALNAMVQTAEVARHRGVDLYGYELSDGRGIERALDYHAPYVANPSSWPRQQITTYNGDNAALYEPAYSHFQKSAYLSAISKWGRPLNEIRIMGWNTLTHGNLFDLGAGTPIVAYPSITASPDLFVASVQVTISCATSGAKIHYTTDGSTPTTSSAQYAGPFTLTDTATVKAFATKSGMDPSGVASATFTKAAPLDGLPVVAVTASSHQDPNVPEATRDSDFGTRWSADGDGEWIQFELDQQYTVTSLRLSWYSGDSRRSIFDVQVSTDGSSFTTVLSGAQSSGASLDLEEVDIPDAAALFVRVVGHGNTANTWNSITEARLFGGGGSVPSNDPPSVAFATPADGASFDAGADVYVSVDASDADGSVAGVALYLDGALVREESSAPYEWGGGDAAGLDPALAGVAAGTYALRAVATDDDGATAEATVTITVASGGTTPADAPPVVTFTAPGAGATVSGAVDANATAHDPDAGASDGDGITRVVFELGSGDTVVATRTENIAPYDWPLDTTLFADGEYVLRATATADASAGGGTASAQVTVTIDNGSSADVDTDSDGLPDWWEVMHGLDPASPDSDGDGTLDPDEDLDGDGYSNLDEYVNGGIDAEDGADVFSCVAGGGRPSTAAAAFAALTLCVLTAVTRRRRLAPARRVD